MGRLNRLFSVCAVVAAASLASASQAHAQAQAIPEPRPARPGPAPGIPAAQPPLPAPPGQASETVPDLSPEPARERGGLALGGFVLDAGGSVAERYDDNIFATRNNRQADYISIVSPFIDARSRWDRHEVKLDASASIARHYENPSEDYEDFTIGSEGRYDVTKNSDVFGGMRFSREHESRESPDDVAGSEPTRYYKLDGHAGTSHRIDGTSIRFGGAFERYNFIDVPAAGGSINNDDRDRTQYELGGRVGHELVPSFEAFVQGVVNFRRYDAAVDDSGFDRDSRGYSVAGGVRFNRNRSLSGEIFAGYLGQSYQDSRFTSIAAPDFGARVRWRPVPTTTLVASVDRSVEETTLFGSPGSLDTTFSLSIDHAVDRDLSLYSSIYYGHYDFHDIGRVDEITAYTTGTRYYLTSNLYVGGEYKFIRRDSTDLTQTYDDNQWLLKFGGHLSDGYQDLEPDAPRQSGFYGGLQALHSQMAGRVTGPRGNNGTLTADFGDDGFGGGPFFGYGGSIDRWYIGVELEGSANGGRWTHARLPGGRVFSMEKQESVGGSTRLGRWLDNGALVYARVGADWAKFKSQYDPANEPEAVQSIGRFGLRAGGGAEVPMSDRFFARLDYGFTDYRDYDVAYGRGGNSDNFDPSESVVRFGVGYRFHDAPVDYDESEGVKAKFSGGYLGGQGGYGSLTSLNTGPREQGSTLTADRGSHGPSGGLFGGYGHLFDRFYLGAELEVGTSAASWEVARDPNGRVYSVEKGLNWGGSARLGYVLPRDSLLYGRIGAVRTTFRTKYADSGNSVDEENTVTGLRFGGGFEIPATDRVFLRFDYTRTEYQNYAVDYRSGVDQFDTTENLFQIGALYRF